MALVTLSACADQFSQDLAARSEGRSDGAGAGQLDQAGQAGQALTPPETRTGRTVGGESPARANGTGTFVGQQVTALSNDLQSLNARIASQEAQYKSLSNDAAAATQRYYALACRMNQRLQRGTTPGNPALVAEWQTAQTELDEVAANTSRLQDLSNRTAANADLASYLLEATRAAFRVQGSLDRDHQQLSQIKTQLNQAMVKDDQLLSGIYDAIGRNNGILFTERRNLKSLALAVSDGRIINLIKLPDCAEQLPKDVIVLLEGPDGKVGAVVVTAKGNTRRLDQAGKALDLDQTQGQAAQAFAPPKALIDRTFGGALAAKPIAPESFMLYFENDATDMTRESLRTYAAILDTAHRRSTLDISVVGHTDRFGRDPYNYELSQRRAVKIRDKLVADGVDPAVIEISYHGENNPLVPTADEVREPRNRRVEVTIR